MFFPYLKTATVKIDVSDLLFAPSSLTTRTDAANNVVNSGLSYEEDVGRSDIETA
jgi:hypothetical protein